MVEVISNDDLGLRGLVQCHLRYHNPGHSLLVFVLVSLDVLNLVIILSTEDDDLHFCVGKHS